MPYCMFFVRATQTDKGLPTATFAADSYSIGSANYSSRCISRCEDDYVEHGMSSSIGLYIWYHPMDRRGRIGRETHLPHPQFALRSREQTVVTCSHRSIGHSHSALQRFRFLSLAGAKCFFHCTVTPNIATDKLFPSLLHFQKAR